MTEVFLSIGSNIGDREGYLREALRMLESLAGGIVSISSIWETEPWGFKAETSFLNMAVKINTELSPEKMLSAIHSVEKVLGRLRRGGGGYQSRTIDIDILFWGNEIISSPYLKVPHPAMAHRLFVMVPLNEIAPDFIHPVKKITVAAMLSCCDDHLKISLYNSSGNFSRSLL